MTEEEKKINEKMSKEDPDSKGSASDIEDTDAAAKQNNEEMSESGEDKADEKSSSSSDSEDGAEDEGSAAADKAEDPEAEVMDGTFKAADEKKGFFKRKKDKRDEKIEELADQVKRQMAEFDNFRKRTDKEKSQMFETGARSVIEKILPVVDNFERGLEAAGENPDDPFAQGMEKIYKQLTQTLEQIGVTPIEAVGKEFNPDYHNAVLHCEDDSVGENIVVKELQKGYLYRDTVVRHSMVQVAN